MDRGINTSYAISIPAILKYCEILFSILTFATAAGGGNDFQPFGGGWVIFTGVLGFLVALAFFLLYFFSVYPDFMIQYMIEPITNGILSAFYLISGIVAATKASWFPSAGAASFFAFLCMVLFAVDAVIIFLNNRSSSPPRTTTTTTTNTAAPPEYAGQNAVY